jgi:hypothetical protein
MKELEKLIMALYKNNYNLQRFLPPQKEPQYSLERRLGGPQNQSGRCGEEKHLAPARNPSPAVQPVGHRDATDTGVIEMECTPPHNYFSLDFCL